MPVSWAAAASR
jgi:hypothetical protein